MEGHWTVNKTVKKHGVKNLEEKKKPIKVSPIIEAALPYNFLPMIKEVPKRTRN